MDLADTLRQAIDSRCASLQTRLHELRGTVQDDRLALAPVLELFSFFPRALNEVVSQEWDRNPSKDSRVQLLRPLLQHATQVATFIDEWLTHRGSPDFPFYLLDAVERECEDLGIGNRKAIIAASRADNFTTVVANLEAVLFGKLGPLCPQIPADLIQSFAILCAQRFEGREVWWHPVLLGHELGHLACRTHMGIVALDLRNGFDFPKAQSIAGPGGSAAGLPTALRLFDMAERWAEELLCDARAVQSFGAAGVAAMSEFLETVGATDHFSDTHPPSRLRNHLMAQWLGPVHRPRIEAIVEPWRELAAEPIHYSEQWAQFLVEYLISRADDIYAVAATWSPTRSDDDRAAVVDAAADALQLGIPPEPTVVADGRRQALTLPDVITAAWLGRIEGFKTPVDRLAEKSMSDMQFLRRWGEAGGTWPIPRDPVITILPETTVLSAEQLRRRLFAADNKRLVVTPLLPEYATGASIDLRLGNGFIVFVRSLTASFDPLQQDRDPRQVQRKIELAWGDSFVLHPSELVLAATLEYIVLPDDLTAQVVSRSSYGRLGLLSATAIQVHPNFHGCLTLELVNLGTVPLVLTPGERIAQLVVSPSGSVTAPVTGKYHCPIGPEFSKVRSDHEAEVLRALTSYLGSNL